MPLVEPLFLSMSEALRHVIDRTRRRWIPLQEELDFIQNYAALERARNPSLVTITVTAEGDLDVPIPPMLLATLFENAVKHGHFPDGKLEIAVRVAVRESDMSFEVTNRFPDTRDFRRNLGVGQSNVRSRLQMLYPGASQFQAYSRDGLYYARITIRR
jgi:two-component system LytT family sensor kinase